MKLPHLPGLIEYGDFGDFRAREEHNKLYGFVRVSAELVAALKPHCVGDVVEVMAGTGWLAKNLRDAGVTLRATDDYSWLMWRRTAGDAKWPTHSPVEKEDAAESVREADTVIMLWPYMDDAAHRTALAMKRGASLIYCGEGSGGCTASDGFFDLVAEWEKDDLEAVNEAHRRWFGIHDYWTKYTKPAA